MGLRPGTGCVSGMKALVARGSPSRAERTACRARANRRLGSCKEGFTLRPARRSGRHLSMADVCVFGEETERVDHLRLMRSWILLGVLCTGASAWSAPVSFSSGLEQVALIELYTSEGCSSCPPAERWLGELRDDPLSLIHI